MTEENKNEQIEDEAPEAAENDDASNEADTVEEEYGDPVETLQAEVADLKDRLVRALAETENVRRRGEKDRADASAYAVTGFARDMISVSDNLRRALDSLPDETADDMKAFIEGVDMTERELLNTFERHGISKVSPEIGDKFDHKFHQAMFEVPTADHPNGTVMQVVAEGYVIKDRLLRPAMVGVAKAAEQPKVDTEA